MNNKALYIIGNGFDLHFGIKSKYTDFEDYVKKNDRILYNKLSDYFDNDELWSDFEQTLAYIDIDTLVDDAGTYLESYASDNWRESANHNYQFALQEVTDAVTKDLKKAFTDWILQLEIPDDLSINLPENAIYLVFNYTDTIEKNTDIPLDNIVYIHNKAVDNNSNLILGHHRTIEGSYSEDNDEDTDPRVAEGNHIIDDYFRDTYKDTETIIQENQDFFSKLKSIEKIIVLGHSISEVDIEYFNTIKKNIPSNAKWLISYFKEDEKDSKVASLLEIGLSNDNINLQTIDEITS